MVTTRSSGRDLTKLPAESQHTPRKRERVGAETNGHAKRLRLPSTTDHSRWRMLDEEGRHTWHYLEDDDKIKDWPQSYADKWYLGLPTVNDYPSTCWSSSMQD